jgi:hypothetical protein
VEKVAINFMNDKTKKLSEDVNVVKNNISLDYFEKLSKIKNLLLTYFYGDISIFEEK